MLLLTSTLLLSGCAVETNSNAVLDGIQPLVDAHAEALLEDGGPKSTVTGVTLIKVLDDLSRQ